MSAPAPAVTISIAKHKGLNAVAVVDDVMRKVHSLQGSLIPGEVQLSVTRDYGATAADKSNELLEHMAIAVVSVGLLIWLGAKFGIPFGKLPGDIHVQKEKFSFYFPIVTCILVSVVLSLVMWIFNRR